MSPPKPMVSHQRIARKLSFAQRELLFRHIGDPLPIEPGSDIAATRRALQCIGLISGAHPGGVRRSTMTRITDDGRQVAAYALADCAEQLITAGYLERGLLPWLPSGQLAIMEPSLKSQPPPSPSPQTVSAPQG